MSIRENFCFRLRSWLSSFSLRLESGERGGGQGLVRVGERQSVEVKEGRGVGGAARVEGDRETGGGGGEVSLLSGREKY